MAKPFEYDDPMELVCVELPADEEAMREMAYVFAEEFARVGFNEKRLLGLFKNRFYTGPHRVLRALGERAVEKIVAECVGIWGRLECGVGNVECPVREESETPRSALRTVHQKE